MAFLQSEGSMGILRKLFTKKQTPDTPESLGTTEDVDLACAICSRAIANYHYNFESIMIARVLGWQCPGCGRVFCKEHVAESDAGALCPECGGKLLSLEEGPAYSSMVEAAQRNGRYTGFIHPPNAKRPVKLG